MSRPAPDREDGNLVAGGPTETSEVDLSLIEYCLSLSPAERLRQAEEYAEFVVSVRERNGLPWCGFENSSGS